MNYDELKRNIADVVKPNGNQEITGQIMQDALFALIENLGEGWQFGGAVRPSDVPALGADVRGFWLAVEKGVYADFGGVEVTELSAIVYGDGWGVLPLGVAFGVDTEAEIGALSERVKALEADGSVTTSRIADGAVTTPKIADTAVTSDKIADYAVKGKKIASGAITNDKIRAGAVSADKLNTDLLSMINSLGAGYQFIGVATPTTSPENPDAKVFYIANGKGTYTNFGGIEVTEDEVVILYYDTEWHKVATGIASQEKLTELERDLGQYAELPSVAMTAETTGKYINADGEFVDDADFNIAAIGAVVVGNTYELYMGSAANMKLGVALFVARIKTTTTSGTEMIEYVPLFSAMSTDIPMSGYVCFEAMEAYSDVLVCYRADIPEATTLLVRRYGTKASIATQINNLRKKVASLHSGLSSVETAASTNRADLDRTMSQVASPDDRALPLLCGQPPILFGAGTPKEAIVPDNWNQYDPETGEGYNWNGKPSAIGQQYVDTTAASGGRYIAVRDGEWDLKWINC